MNWNLFWGLYCLVFAAACWLCAFFLCIRPAGKEKRCTAHAKGRITRYSAVSYGGIHLPVVEYKVDGIVYKITGPKFRSVLKTVKRTPLDSPGARMETNLTTRGALPDRLVVKIFANSLVNAGLSPLLQLYPIGSAADVYYNPSRPRDAFVERFEGVSRWVKVLLLFLAVVITAAGAAILFGPEIIM